MRYTLSQKIGKLNNFIKSFSKKTFWHKQDTQHLLKLCYVDTSAGGLHFYYYHWVYTSAGVLHFYYYHWVYASAGGLHFYYYHWVYTSAGGLHFYYYHCPPEKV
jgi:hypothetical protein